MMFNLKKSGKDVVFNEYSLDENFDEFKIAIANYINSTIKQDLLHEEYDLGKYDLIKKSLVNMLNDYINQIFDGSNQSDVFGELRLKKTKESLINIQCDIHIGSYEPYVSVATSLRDFIFDQLGDDSPEEFRINVANELRALADDVEKS